MRTTLLLLLAFSAHGAAGDPLEGKLAAWGVALPGLHGFRVESERGGPSEVLVAKGPGGRELRLTRSAGMEEKAASRYVSDHRAEILSMYDRHFDGYFPSQAQGVVCKDAMKPVEREGGESGHKVRALVAYASARKTFGVCLKEQAKFRAVAAYAYCAGRKEMYELKYFVPVKKVSPSDEKVLLSFQCDASAHS
jgi:hypothetical protein